MVKYMIIMLSFSSMSHVYAMENSICCLAYMPSDVQKQIVYFLMCGGETEEEFIERTKKRERIAGPDYDEFLITEKSVFGTRGKKKLPMSNNTLRVFSPYKTKTALLRLPNSSEKNPILTVIDEKEKQVTCIDEKFDKADYRCIALSPCADMLATVECKRVRKYNCCQGYWYNEFQKFLVIKNLIEKSTRELGVLPSLVSSIDFNMQGTHVIVHYLRQNGIIPDPSIFSINSAEHKIDSKDSKMIELPTLREYFEEWRICKNIEYSK